jgi:hypothetical protein
MQPPAWTHAMEFWEITSKRAQQTLTVWSHHAPTMHIGAQGVAVLRELILGFEPLVQARAAARADYWEAFYQGQAALRELKDLGIRLALILHGHLDDDTPQMQALQAAYKTAPCTEATILRRMRELLPLWERVNAAQTPITCLLHGRVLDVTAVRGLLEAYERTVATIQDKSEVLKQCRAALRTHERAADRLNKRWYQVAKASADEGTALAEALRGITTTAGGRVKVKAVIHSKPGHRDADNAQQFTR